MATVGEQREVTSSTAAGRSVMVELPEYCISSPGCQIVDSQTETQLSGTKVHCTDQLQLYSRPWRELSEGNVKDMNLSEIFRVV